MPNLISVLDQSNLTTLITPAFYQPPPNAQARGIPMTRFGRFGHICLLHLMPLLVYVPAGLVCHWFAFESVGFGPQNFGPFDSAKILYALIGSYLGGPLVYALIGLIYYGVSSFQAMQHSHNF